MSTTAPRTTDWLTFTFRADKDRGLKPQVVVLSLLLTLSLMIGMISGCNFKGHGGGGGGGGGQPAPTFTSLSPSSAVVNTGPVTEVIFNNAASPPTISEAGGESGAYDFVPAGDTYQGQGLGFIFYVTNRSQLILFGPAGHGLAFLVQR